MSALVEVENVSKRFEPRLTLGERIAAALGSAIETRTVHALDRVSLDDRRRRGRRAGRRIRLRQVHARPRHRRHPAAVVRDGAHRRRAGHGRRPTPRQAHHARADGVPGSVRLARSAHARRRRDRRRSGRARAGDAFGRGSLCGEMARGGRSRPATSRAAFRISSPAGSASASRSRARSRCSPTCWCATSRSPRSTCRSRRRSSTCSSSCAASSASPCCSSATTSAWCATSPIAIAIMYLGRIVEIGEARQRLREPAASLYARAARQRAEAGARRRRDRQLQGDQRRTAVGAVAAERLPFPSALPARGRALPRRGSGAARDRGRDTGGVSPCAGRVRWVLALDI